jgi:hypothetical protein
MRGGAYQKLIIPEVIVANLPEKRAAAFLNYRRSHSGNGHWLHQISRPTFSTLRAYGTY